MKFSRVLLLIGAGVLLRVLYFDAMEFKADEAEAILLAKYWLGRGIPRFGLMSGAGILNPPGFIFVLLPVLLFTSSPLAVGLYVAAFGLAAIFLIYRLGVEIGSPGAGLWAGAFLAAHPWLILYSRKIWAQSLLPFFVLLLLLAVVRCGRKSRSRAVFWTGPLLALTWQIHYSAYSVALVFSAWFLVEAARKNINRRWAMAGFLAGILLLAPYLSHSLQTGFLDIRRSVREIGGGPGCPILDIVKVWAGTSFAGNFGYPFSFRPVSLALTPLGVSQPWLQPVAVAGTALVLALAAAGALIRPGKEGETAFRPSLEFWLALFAVSPILLYLARGRAVPPHYFIVGLPALLLLAGLGVEKCRRGWGAGGRASRLCGRLPDLAGIAVVLGGGVLWISFISYINRAGGTAGDYGIAYRCQAAVAEKLASEKIHPRAIDARLTRDNSIGVFYLLSLKSRPPFAPQTVRIIDSLLFPGRVCGPGEIRREVSGSGPLEICFAPAPEPWRPARPGSPR